MLKRGKAKILNSVMQELNCFLQIFEEIQISGLKSTSSNEILAKKIT